MLREAEDGAIQSDAYIDALLDGHARLPVALPVAGDAPEPDVRRVIQVLEHLPRHHPSFLFEEKLADELRAAADQRLGGSPIPATIVIERRVVIGGAIASGVSLAGAAMWAWRHRPRSAAAGASAASSAGGQD
jgi:ferric-dicitrate binding protein FerR (iron transport regulator)